jgi:hypothetical protein
MNQYKLVYEDGKTIIVNGNNVQEVVRKYNLATVANINTKIMQLA